MLTGEIARALSARIEGDESIKIDRLVHPACAEGPSDLALAMSQEAAAALAGSKAQAVVVLAKNGDRSLLGDFKAVISIDEARSALAKLTALFDRGPAIAEGVHPTAVVAPDAVIGEGVRIGAYSVIGARSRIGAATTIMPHVTVGSGVRIGAQCLFHSGVRIGHDVVIGNRVIVHSNAVIGSDGFSYAPDLNSPIGFTADVKVTRIHSLGNVEIGDDVEIGAGTTIDRATVQTTRIGRGTKIDNLVHIGHNVVIGESCILAGMVGISGSVTIGDRVRIAGRAGISDHVRVGDEAVIGPGSGVATNVEAGAFVLGYPAIPRERALEQFVYGGRQKRLHRRVDEMASRLDALERMVKK
ncbi:MAG: UDP-3-O-(3-hydroxymyristoyl)glucosamine N-acyltransferase [Pseudolabrys sp.]|nr:UDP-3-O-(3-hydroxymyristoyl)glucosamine N-acyltransferase [Pseudolabrys sp.]